MLKNPLSIKLLKEATTNFLEKLGKTKKEEHAIVKEVNQRQKEEDIKKVREKLGI